MAKNRLADTLIPGFEGALACLETYYYCLHAKDILTLRQIWHRHELVELQSPGRSVMMGINAIIRYYNSLFFGPALLLPELTDITYYHSNEMAVFTGVEKGIAKSKKGLLDLATRVSYLLGYSNSRKQWYHVHHHASIDSPEKLSAFRNITENPS